MSEKKRIKVAQDMDYICKEYSYLRQQLYCMLYIANEIQISGAILEMKEIIDCIEGQIKITDEILNNKGSWITRRIKEEENVESSSDK